MSVLPEFWWAALYQVLLAHFGSCGAVIYVVITTSPCPFVLFKGLNNGTGWFVHKVSPIDTGYPTSDSMTSVDDTWALDESLYALDEAETQFLTSQTGVTDPEELKKHVLNVQAEIYAVRSQSSNT